MATTSTSSVSGLASGLDTASIVSQLMQVERQPQNQLKNQVSAQQTRLGAYQSVNTKMKNLQDAAGALTEPSTWQAARATSSSTVVAVTAGPGAISGQYTFDVLALAQAQVTTAAMPTDGAATAAGGVDVTIGTADPVHVAVSTDTPQGVADAINSANLGIRATAINSDQGPILQFSGTKTGMANRFTIAGLTSSTVDQIRAKDARIGVGDQDGAGYSVSSSSNTFTNLIPHVTLTATQVQDGVTITVGSDSGAIADKMQAMVDAANTALAEITKQTAYTPASDGSSAGTASPLLADLTVQALQQHILGTVSAGTADFGSFAGLGVQLAKDGTLSFDRGTFLAAYDRSPVDVKTAVSTGLAKPLDDLGDGATHYGTGSLTTAIQGTSAQIDELTDQVNDWTARLADRQKLLEQQFNAMEVALGKLKDQSNWLTGEINSLPNLSNSGG
jgi:flagellar hook-associated protein 2